MSKSHSQRVFIADPSFQDWLGHHAPYDLSVKEAVERAGGRAVILANRVVNIGEKQAEPNFERVFSKTSWGASTAQSGVQRVWHKILIRSHPFLLFLTAAIAAALTFPVSMPWLACKFVARCRRDLNNPATANSRLCLVYKVMAAAWVWLMPPCFKKFLLRAASFCKRTVVSLFPPIVFSLAEATRLALRDIAPPHWLLWLLTHPQHDNYYELVEALKRHDFSQGDTVFAHMLTSYSLPLWALMASRLGRGGGKGRAILLFRYPGNFINNGGLKAGLCLRTLEKAFASGSLRGATDSDLLSQEYAHFLAVPLITYPICHLPKILPSARIFDKGKPLTCVSLGNARAEKGILEIFEAIKFLNSEGYEKTFNFILQVNDPDPNSREGLRCFSAQLPPNVELRSAALSPKEYEDLLATADIVLAPYWSDVYATRTSGVALEGMATGKIVVSTTKSWMAYELKKFNAACRLVRSRDAIEIAEALAEISWNPQPYIQQAEATAKAARRFHNGEILAGLLLGTASPRRIQKQDQLLMCFPFYDFFEGKSGASSRVGHLARMFEDYRLRFFIPHQAGERPLKLKSEYTVVMYDGAPWSLFVWWNHLLATLMWLINRADRFMIPIFLDQRRNREFKLQLLRNMLSCQAVVVEYPFHMKLIAPYARALGLPVVMTAYDRHAPAFRENSFMYKLIKGWEDAAARQADVLFTVADYEHDYFKTQGVPNILVPSSADIVGLMEKMQNCEYRQITEKLIGPYSRFVFFVGSGHPPNIEAKKILKNLAANALRDGRSWKFVVVGSCCESSESQDNFFALGKVSDEALAALYAASAMIVSPLPGGTGASVKTVESMGVGKVILGTTATFRGLSVSDGQECFIEDNPSKYLERLNSLLEKEASEEILKAVAQRAKEFGQQYDYRAVMKRYVQILEDWPDLSAFSELK